MKKKLFIVLAASLALAVTGCSNNAPKDSGMEIFKPGAYRVTVEGHNGPITVITTFTKDKVEKIQVETHEESVGVGDTAMQSVADEIIAKQSFEVDVVTGATYSSYAMLEAVSTAAANGAGADVQIIKMPVPVAPASAGEHDLANGELLGAGMGMGGAIEVKVVMDGDKIADVEILSHNETPGISDKAISDIPTAIVEAQSANVDTVSGATISSNGIMDAVKDAMGKI